MPVERFEIGETYRYCDPDYPQEAYEFTVEYIDRDDPEYVTVSGTENNGEYGVMAIEDEWHRKRHELVSQPSYVPEDWS